MNIFIDKSVLETGNQHLAEVTVHTYIDTAWLTLQEGPKGSQQHAERL